MKETLLAGTIIVALTSYFSYHTLYERQQVERVRLQAALREERANQLSQTEVATVLRDIERYRERLSPTRETSWLVNQVLTLADAAGVSLTTIVPEPPRAVGGFTSLGVALQFTASYHELGAFLDRVEHATPFIRVDHVEVSPPTAKTPDSGAFVRIILRTLYMSPPSGLVETAVTSGGSVTLRQKSHATDTR